MKNKMLMLIAKIAEKTAVASVNSASFYSMYQPKEPDALKKEIREKRIALKLEPKIFN